MSDWISIEDRLPKCSTWILIATTSPLTRDRIASMAFFESNKSSGEVYWLDHSSGENLGDGWEDVTHWMPLPEPPKESK